MPGYHAKSKGDIRFRHWDSKMNGHAKETDFAQFSHKRAWWLCGAGHNSWAKIQDVHRGHACPYCMNKKVSPENSLAAVYPVVAQEWDPRRNGQVTPAMVIGEAGLLVAWKCKFGHRWRAKVADRTRGKKKCPVCTSRKAHIHNSLATLRRDIAREWHPTKNEKRPLDVTVGSSYRAWWRCEHGSEWQATVFNRVHGWGRCPHLRYKRYTFIKS